jgi:DNA-binding response OmpR family regulator
MSTLVYLVEDNHLLLRALRSLLVRMSCEVRTGASVAQAARDLESLRPHVMLLDDRLPDGRSLDVMKALWRSAGARPVAPPVVVMSTPNGSDLSDDYLGALKARGSTVDVVNKPLDMQALRALLQDRIEGSRDPAVDSRSGLGRGAPSARSPQGVDPDVIDDGKGRPSISSRFGRPQHHTNDSFWIDGDWGVER